jgi:hypothetical protein
MESRTDTRSLGIAKIVVAVAMGLMLFVGLWEIGMPVANGHFAVVGSRGIIADNFLIWKMISPVRSYCLSAPRGTDVYAHHPWITFWLIGACRYLFGRHDWVPRVYPVVMNALMPGVFYLFGRSLWGTIPGALCALGWAVLPITLAFAQFPGFEVPVVFGCIAFSWALVRFRQTGYIRWGWLAIAAIVFTAQTDWTATLYVLFVCGLAILGLAFAPAQNLAPMPNRRALRFWVVAVAALGACVLFYLKAFDKLGVTQDWLHSAEFRATGNSQPFAEVLQGRRFWLETSFTELGIGVMLLGAVIMLLRLALTRRFEEWLPLVFLLVSTIHYFYFKNAADIHIYWPLPFAAQFALSLGAIAANVLDVVKKQQSTRAHRIRPLVLVGMAAVTLLILPDGIRGLNFARDTGGRFNEHGRLILQDVDKTNVLRFLAPKIPQNSRVALDSSMHPNWAQEFALERPISEVNLARSGKGGGDRYRFLDARFSAASTLSQIASQSPVVVVGPFWFIDGDKDPTPIVAYRFVNREPRWWEWFLIQAHDPMQSIQTDPMATWELRLHFGQKPNPEPTQSGGDFEGVRIGHNLAVQLGAEEAIKTYRAKLEHSLDHSYDDTSPNGVRFIGQRFTQGVLNYLELYFIAPGPLDESATYNLWSVVKQRAPLSLVMPDDTTKSQCLKFAIPPALWKTGMIYVSVSEIRKRPGVEVFEGAWTNSKSRRLLELN